MSTSTKRISAIAVGVALVLITAWYLALFSPQSKKLSSTHKANAVAQQNNASLRTQIVQLQALEKMIPADTKKYATLSAAVPDRPQLDTALVQLNTIARQSGVLLSSVQPPSSGPGQSTGSSSSQQSASGASGPPTIQLTLSATGSYPQLMHFLTLLAGIPRVFVVDHLGLAGAGNQMTASMAGRIFYAGQSTP